MSVMERNEGTGSRKGHRGDTQLMSEHGLVTLPVADAAQRVTGKILRDEMPKQRASPFGILLDPGCDVLKQAGAARSKLEVSILPYFLNRQRLELSAEQANGVFMHQSLHVRA
jgi:CBS-domain-containing membrane protein